MTIIERNRQVPRRIAVLASIGFLALFVSACTIPTEEQPKPIEREQTTTTASENP